MATVLLYTSWQLFKKETMKTILTILMSILTLAVFGQDTTYYANNGDRVNSLKSCDRYEILERDQTDTNKVVVKVYFKSGQIESERNYNPYCKRRLDGKRKEWYKNGQIRMNVDYKNGKLNGQVLTYWENGQLKRHDYFENGKLIKGKVWNFDGRETEYYDFEIKPKFPGGTDGLVQYLGAKLKYPRKSQKKGIEGWVYVHFVVGKDGNVSHVKVVKGINKEMDAEAVKVVKGMPKWEPGMEDGRKVSRSFYLPVRFRLTRQ